jgi:hypothetical protein
VLAATVLVAAAVLLLLRQPFENPSAPALPSEVVAPPGTPLPDGFAVPQGAVQLGPLLVEREEGGRPADWLAVLAIEGDALAAWKDYARRLAELYPEEGVEPEDLPGCGEDRQDGFGCELRVDAPDVGAGTIVAGATLLNAPDDVTGRYLMVLSVMKFQARLGSDLYPDERSGWSGGKPPLPEPARRPPDPGEALAPSSTAYEGDDDRYVLLEGSKVLAQWGTGSLTGGFDLLLGVLPGGVVRDVAHAYARQAAQYEGPIGQSRVQVGETTYVRYLPPGGAGGYQGEIWAVDRPGKEDYVFYSLSND